MQDATAQEIIEAAPVDVLLLAVALAQLAAGEQERGEGCDKYCEAAEAADDGARVGLRSYVEADNARAPNTHAA